MDKKYFAFISYQRSDEKQAEWLRRKLEDYHLPAKLRKENKALPKAIRPIFRDSLELSGGFLAKEIETALGNSKYLIVVCSPKSAQSPWVNKEIETFINQGREKYIIPYIIDGTPFSNDPQTECFPPALRALRGEKELLGININEMGREAAAIKVVARMFGLSFDTLWQRYNREQRRKRVIWSAAAISLVIISSIVATYFIKLNKEIEGKNQEILLQHDEILQKNNEIEKQYAEIQQKNIEITRTNSEIIEKNEEISRRNEEILRGKDKLLISQSKYLASEVEKELAKGNITKALRMALYALPKNLDNPDRPFSVDAEASLRIADKPIMGKSFCRTVLQHNDELDLATFSVDGKRVITSSVDYSLRIWDARTGIHKGSPLLHDGFNGFVAFSPNGKRIITMYNDFIYVWDAQTGKQLNKFACEDYIGSFSYSPDGEYVAVAHTPHEALKNRFKRSKSWKVTVFETKTSKRVLGPIEYESNIDVHYTPDGKFLAVEDDCSIDILDAKTGEEYSYIYNDKSFDEIIYSPDGETIATTSYNDSIVHIWDVESGDIKVDLQHDSRVNSIDYSKDGKRILTASWDKNMQCGVARVWNTKTGKPEMKPMSCKASIISAKFSPDEKFILTVANNKTVYIWDTRTCEHATNPLVHMNEVSSAIFSPDSKQIMTTSRDKCAYIWEFKETAPKTLDDYLELFVQETDAKSDYVIKHNAVIESLNFSNDGNSIVTTEEGNKICVWNARTLQQTISPMFHKDRVYSAQFSPDDKYIVTASADNTACVWDAKNAELITTFMYHSDKVYTAKFSPNGKYVVTASKDKTSYIWDAMTGKVIAGPLSHSDEINGAVFSPDGRNVVTASNDGTARVWNAKTGKPVTHPLLHKDKVNSAYFSPDGKSIVTSSDDNTACVWDAKSGKPLTETLKHNSNVTDAIFSPEGGLILTVSWDNTARVWDAETGRMTIPVLWHESNVSSAMFSPDGKYIATASDNGMAYVWDARTGQRMITPFAHGSNLYDLSDDKIRERVVFKPKGNRIFAVFLFDEVFIYSFPSLQELLDKYNKDPEHDWSLSEEEKEEYSLE